MCVCEETKSRPQKIEGIYLFLADIPKDLDKGAIIFYREGGRLFVIRKSKILHS